VRALGMKYVSLINICNSIMDICEYLKNEKTPPTLILDPNKLLNVVQNKTLLLHTIFIRPS